jgi:hypothetical protein
LSAWGDAEQIEVNKLITLDKLTLPLSLQSLPESGILFAVVQFQNRFASESLVKGFAITAIKQDRRGLYESRPSGSMEIQEVNGHGRKERD